MAAVSDPGSNPNAGDPYSRLGLSAGASFEAVQSARQRCLAEAGDDPQERARVEAAYDAVLMARLRDRQDGQVSQAAASASEREQIKGVESPAVSLPGVGVLQRFRSNLPDPSQSLSSLAPQWSLVEGQGLIVRLVAGALALLFLVFSPSSSQVVLSLSVIGSFLSHVRRGRRALPALGWSLLTLLAGLLLGTLLTALLPAGAGLPLLVQQDQLQALPAVLLLWLGSLFLT